MPEFPISTTPQGSGSRPGGRGGFDVGLDMTVHVSCGHGQTCGHGGCACLSGCREGTLPLGWVSRRDGTTLRDGFHSPIFGDDTKNGLPSLKSLSPLHLEQLPARQTKSRLSLLRGQLPPQVLRRSRTIVSPHLPTPPQVNYPPFGAGSGHTPSWIPIRFVRLPRLRLKRVCMLSATSFVRKEGERGTNLAN